MTASIACLLFKLIIPLIAVWAIILWIDGGQPARIRRMAAQGASQRSIAQSLGITRHRVRVALA